MKTAKEKADKEAKRMSEAVATNGAEPHINDHLRDLNSTERREETRRRTWMGRNMILCALP